MMKSGDIAIEWAANCSVCFQPIRAEPQEVKEDPKASKYSIGHWHNHGPCFGAAHIITMKRSIKARWMVGSPQAQSEIERRNFGGDITRHVTWLCQCKCGQPCFAEPLLLEENDKTGVDAYSVQMHVRDHLTHGGFITTIWRRLRTA